MERKKSFLPLNLQLFADNKDDPDPKDPKDQKDPPPNPKSQEDLPEWAKKMQSQLDALTKDGNPAKPPVQKIPPTTPPKDDTPPKEDTPPAAKASKASKSLWEWLMG